MQESQLGEAILDDSLRFPGLFLFFFYLMTVEYEVHKQSWACDLCALGSPVAQLL